MFLQLSWSIFIGLVVVVLASLAAWFLSPKGETQTYVLPSHTIAPASVCHIALMQSTNVTLGYGEARSSSLLHRATLCGVRVLSMALEYTTDGHD